jgi:hypothetical protein
VLGAAPFGRLGAGLFLGSLLGALLLVVAEFTTLYTEHISTSQIPLMSTTTGSNDSYALIPIAVLALLLGFAVLRAGSRPALLALGITGVVALLIALLGDLPNAQSSGNLLQSTGSQHVFAANTPSTGMYLETAGAIVLIATFGLGFMLLGPPRRRTQPNPAPPSAPPDARPEST